MYFFFKEFTYWLPRPEKTYVLFGRALTIVIYTSSNRTMGEPMGKGQGRQFKLIELCKSQL